MKKNMLIKIVKSGLGIAVMAMLFAAAACAAGTDFVCAIRASGSENPAADYTTLSAWEAAIGSDLTSSSSKVFTVSGRGSYASQTDDGTAVTFTGGGTGVLRHINNSNKAYITGCDGAINAGIVTCASLHTFTISDTGSQIGLAIAECYNDWPEGLVDNLILDGFTADSERYVKIYAPIGQKHMGIAGTGFRLKCGSSGSNAILVSNSDCDYTRISAIEIVGPDAHVSNEYGIMINHEGVSNCEVSNSIIHGFTGRGGRGICQCGSAARVYRNRIYDIDNAGISCNNNSAESYYFDNIIYNSGMYGIVVSSSSTGASYIYNNTVHNCLTKGLFFAQASSAWQVKNNISMASGTADFDLNGIALTASNNISSDATAPGASSLTKKTIDDIRFVSLTSGYEDLRLMPDSCAVGAATDLSTVFTDDIDGHTRAGWDIGADEAAAEFVCAIRASGAANPAADYTSLSAWAGAVAVGGADLTANQTRAFSGSKTGAIADGALLTLYREGVNKKITGICVHSGASQILVKDISDASVSGASAAADGGAFSFAPGDQWRANAGSFRITDKGDTASVIAECYNDWPNGLADSLTLNSNYPYYTDSQHAVVARALSSERHGGTARGGFYLKPAAGARYGIALNRPAIGVRIQGLEIDGSAASATANTAGFAGIVIEPYDAGYDFEVSNCLIHDCGEAAGAVASSSYSGVGIAAVNDRARLYNVKIFNNILYDIAFYGINLDVTAGGYVYSNTVYNACAASAASPSKPDTIFAKNTNTVLAKNNIAIGLNAGKDFAGTFATGSGYNASKDTTAPGENSLKSISAADNFVSIDTGLYDLRLKPKAPCIDKGEDLSNDSHIRFNTDIEGDIRGAGNGVWSIGADEYAAVVISGLTGQQNAGQGIVTLSYIGAHSEASAECAYISSDCEYSLDSTNGADGVWRVMTRNDSGGEMFTTSGANLSYDWNALADAPEVEIASARARLRVKDPNNRKSNHAVSAPFTLDTKPPVGLANFKLMGVGSASAMLTWTPAEDANFKTYRIWYGARLSDVEGRTSKASKWDSANDSGLASAKAVATTIKGITWGSDTYYFKIWALDDYGNESAISPGGYVSAGNIAGEVNLLTDSALPDLAGDEEEVSEEEAPEEAVDLDALLSLGRRKGTKLYDILIKFADPGKDAESKTCYDGEIALVKTYGNNWSESERKSYLIIPAHLMDEEVETLMSRKEDGTAKKCKIDLRKLNLRNKNIKRGKQNTDEINDELEQKRVRRSERDAKIRRGKK